MATSKIEKVTNNSGSDYCKMPDGTLICYGYISLESQAASQVGNMYEHYFTVDYSFPIAFQAAPVVHIMQKSQSYGIIAGAQWSNTKITGIIILRPTAGSIYPYLNYIAIGRWK